ncbi:MAG: FtsX-like permease family protein [bacterium]
MRRIEISEQARLGLARVAGLTLDGIRYRIFRASVTVSIVAVAVAFLMNIMSEGIITRVVARNTRSRIAETRLVHSWGARLTSPGSVDSITGDIASAREGDPEYVELTGMTGWSPDATRAIQSAAREATTYLSFFEELDYGRRRNLVSSSAGTAILDRLATDAGWTRFEKAFADMKSVRFVTSLEAFHAFLAKWPAERQAIEHVRNCRSAAVAIVDKARAGRPILEALTGIDGAFGNAVREAGFQLDQVKTASLVAVQARNLLDRQRLERSAGLPALRTLIGLYYEVDPSTVSAPMMWKMLRNAKAAANYIVAMNKNGENTDGLSAEHMAQLSGLVTEEAVLTRAARMTADTGGGWLGLGPRMGWLLFVSMLVCGIGICNAMLMTVTERFREIATLKCLGALDETILIIFVLESCLLGLVGGCGGAVLGSLIGLGRMMIAFGATCVRAVPVTDMFIGMGAAVGAGVVLASIAAVYPAFRAARLAPMEAMRIE